MSVYILKHPDGFYKIGKSDSPGDRYDVLKSGSPYRVTLWRVIVTYNDGTSLETELHREFAEYHANGEWFKIDEDELVDRIKEKERDDEDVLSIQDRSDFTGKKVVPNAVKGCTSSSVSSSITYYR